MDIDGLMQFLMSVLTQSPDNPAGDVPAGVPAQGVPLGMQQATDDEQLMSMLLQLLQQGQLMQSGQQSMNAAQGAQGAMFGSMGGRPPGS